MYHTTTSAILFNMKIFLYTLLCAITLSACSAEYIVPDELHVSEVQNSTCKVTLSQTETRPDFYMVNSIGPATLIMKLGEDGIAKCTIEDIEANCAVSRIYVNALSRDNQLTLIVYHNILEALADCTCKYDVHFKVGKLMPGNYQLKVYYATPNMKYNKSNIAYKGQITLEQGKITYINLDSKGALPET